MTLPPYEAVTVCGPAAPKTSETEQLALAPEPESVHVDPPMVTVPVGVDVVPASTSVTVAVAVKLSFTTTGFLLRVTCVPVSRGLTASDVLPWLGVCTVDPGYVAVMDCGPAAPNESVTEQLALAPEPDNVHVDPPMVTVPPGAKAGAVSMSVTVAVAVTGSFMAIGFLLRLTCVLVFRGLIWSDRLTVATWGWHAVTLTRQLESVAFTEIVAVPEAGGIPDNAPDVVSDSQDGIETAENVTAPNPPESPNCSCTGTLTVASGSVAGRITSGSPTRIDNVCVAVCWGGVEVGGASTTCTVKEDPLGAELRGVPEIRPLARVGDVTGDSVANCSAAGRGVTRDQLRLAVVPTAPIFPPTAEMGVVYGWPVTPSGRAVVTTVNVTGGVVIPWDASVVPTACAPPTGVKPAPETDDTAEVNESAIRANELASRIGECVDGPPLENTRTVTWASSPGASATVAFAMSALLISALVRVAPLVRNAGSMTLVITWFWNWLIRLHPPFIDATGVRYRL